MKRACTLTPHASQVRYLAKWRICNSQKATYGVGDYCGSSWRPKGAGKTVKNPDDLAQLVRKGLPASSVKALAEKLALGNAVLSRKLGIAQRTMTRRLSQRSRLTPPSRIARFASRRSMPMRSR